LGNMIHIMFARTGKMPGNGLIRRKKGRFAVTTMGRATLQPVAETGKAMEMNWKFRAIDAIDQTTGLRHDARTRTYSLDSWGFLIENMKL
jgi:hypothetical protein